MAAGTCAGCNANVVKLGTRKSDGGVARLTPQGGLKVLAWLHYIGLGQAGTANVATAAVAWSSFENAIDVTRLATCVGMQAC